MSEGPEGGDGDATLRRQLQDLLRALVATGRAVMPGSPEMLLQSIVEAAARIFGAAASSIALADEETGTLNFVVAYGAGRETVVGMRVPMGQGIVGYVAMSGQPLAVSDVQRDQRFAGDVARSTGYVPRSILATPLLSGERVIGVMEVLDKIEAPSFALRDMELLGLFARQAAIAIDQARTIERFGAALVLGLRRLLGADVQPASAQCLDDLASLAGCDQADALRAEDLLALADQFRALAELGEAERRLALRLLGMVAQYAQGAYSRR